MKILQFYNVKTKKKFKSKKYELSKKNTKKGYRYFAITKKGNMDVYRIVSKDFYADNK